MVFAPARRSDRILVVCLVLADIVMVPLLVLLTYWIRTDLLEPALPPFHDTLRDYLPAIPVAVIVWLLVFAWSGLYRPRRFGHYMGDLAKVLKTLAQTVFAMMAVSYLAKEDFSRVMLVLFGITAVPASLLIRGLARRVSGMIAPPGETPRILLVGDGEVARNVIRSLSRLPGRKPEIAGLIAVEGSAGEGRSVMGLPVLGDLSSVHSVIAEHDVDEVFFASPEMERARILSIIAEESSGKVHFRLATDLFSVATTETDLDNVARLPIIEIGPGGLSLAQRFAKRVVDILVSGLLLLLTAPLMILITVVLSLTAKGGPVFRQERVGYRGRRFTLLKFRTMRPDSAEYEVAPLRAGDERVTAVGRILRRTSLDELPQLFNVLLGEMSLVGPRPEMPFIVEEYEPWQRHRLNVKPGLTGLWQIMGRKDLPLHENIEYDFFYIRNQSLMLDFAIMLRTLSTIALGKGAY
ncbi:sugar transferase [Candidatus Fermentibacterales bacterium]|nr:sugar transferase [Candidatus Fermentibacterales bacterium]